MKKPPATTPGASFHPGNIGLRTRCTLWSAPGRKFRKCRFSFLRLSGRGRIVRRKQARFIGQDGDRRPPLWRLTFGTGRPVVNRTPDGQGACCRNHENPHQHVCSRGFF